MGTAGSVAAAAAEQRAFSLGIEQCACPGTTTIGGIRGYYFGTPGGLYTEFDRRVEEYQNSHTETVLESRKIVTEEILQESGAKLMYETVLCGIYLSGTRVCGARVLTGGIMEDFACSVLIDATGDGTACFMAGCEMEFGRDADGLTQPYSMVSVMVDKTTLCTITSIWPCGPAGRQKPKPGADFPVPMKCRRTGPAPLWHICL
ncbi:MAG: FAD-dependent oxidoreductase [Eubacteriales bacterium]